MQAMLDEIREVHETGRPILVGTTSIEKSEEVSEMLARYGIPHQVLNAKYHEREAEIVAQAGRRGAVTIATNMAGRGTDIILGGNPEFMAWADLKRLTDEDGRPLYPTRLEVPKDVWEQAVARYEPEMKAEGREVAAVGGLHIIGTERHESRRIDNQLRGRAGRQGDPGSSRFFLSLEDDLMRKFAGEWVSAVLTRLGMQEGEAIESRMVSRRIEGAQKKVEERNFDIRKNLLEYDEVMDEQRKRVYSFRQGLLEGASPKDMVLEMIDSQIQDAANRFLADDYGAASFAEWVGQRLGVELTARDVKGATFEDAEEIARTRAERQLHETIRQAMDENLPADADPSEWTWQALARWANERFELNLKDSDLRKYARTDGDEFQFGRNDLEEFLNEQAAGSLQKIDLSPAREFLLPDWGRRSLERLGPPQVRHRHRPGRAGPSSTGPRSSAASRPRRARLYAQKEAELPARIAMLRYLGDREAGSQPRVRPRGPGRLGLRALPHRPSTPTSSARCSAPRSRRFLIDLAHRHYQGGRVAEELEAQLDAAGLDARLPTPRTRPPPTPPPSGDLAAWARENLDVDISAAGLQALEPGRGPRPPARRPRRPVPARDARDGEGRPAPDPRLELDGTPPRHGSPPQLDRPPGIRPDRSQGRVQARGHADLRRDVERHRRPRHRPDLPRRALRPRIPRLPGLPIQQARPGPDDPPAGGVATRRGTRRAAASASNRTPRSPAASNRPRRSASRSATLEKRWVGTIPARADPVKSSKPAACGNIPRPTHSDRRCRSGGSPAIGRHGAARSAAANGRRPARYKG